MNEEIVKRLHTYGPYMHGIYKDAMFDAADEIETLREVVRSLVSAYDRRNEIVLCVSSPVELPDSVQWEAVRRALGEGNR